MRRRLADMVALERWGGVRMDEERSMGHERERENSLCSRMKKANDRYLSQGGLQRVEGKRSEVVRRNWHRTKQ